MSERMVFAAAILLVSVSGGSAALSDTYGTISGTTEIDSAVTISINEENNVVLNKETDSGISASDDMRLLNTTDGSNEKLVEEIEIGKDNKELDDVSLSDVGELSLEIDGVVVDKEDIDIQ